MSDEIYLSRPGLWKEHGIPSRALDGLPDPFEYVLPGRNGQQIKAALFVNGLANIQVYSSNGSLLGADEMDFNYAMHHARQRMMEARNETGVHNG